MKLERDMDLIRELLLKMEAGQTHFNTLSSSTARALMIQVDDDVSDEDAQKLAYHLDLLEQAGLVEFGFRSGSGDVLVEALTWKGHDFLDSVRDTEVWANTKAGANAVGGVTFDLITALAKGFLKKKLLDHTGVEIDL